MTVFLFSSLLHTQRLGEMVTLFLFNPRFPCFDFLCPSLLHCSFLLSSFFYRLHPKAPDQKCWRELQLRWQQTLESRQNFKP